MPRIVKGYVIGETVLLGETVAWRPDVRSLEAVTTTGAIDSGWCRPARGQSGHAPPLALEALEAGAHSDVVRLFPDDPHVVALAVAQGGAAVIALHTACAIREAVALVRRAIGLDLFGVDLLLSFVQAKDDPAPQVVAAIVDVNLLPGYKGVPKPELRDAILAHAQQAFKV
jgi:hypothetical protein